MNCQLIIEESPRTGPENMATDEALLNQAVSEGLCAVRLYQWSEPTLSTGYFQKLERVAVPPALEELPRVRRLSGGGAILHHHELTYSCVLPPNHEFTSDPSRIYDRIHAVIARYFASLGADVICRGIQQDEKEGQFLCFLRGDARDLLVGEEKVVGSAQRRRKGAILQHGSILLRRSELLPEIGGLWDFYPQSETEVNTLAAELGPKLADLLGHPVGLIC